MIDARGSGVKSSGEGSAGDGVSAAPVEVDSVDVDSVGMDSVDDERVWLMAREVDSYCTEIARLGLISYREGRTVGAHDLAASYVRPSDAEFKERWHR